MGVPILGTQQDDVDAAEDRERFDEILQETGCQRAAGQTGFTAEEAMEAALVVGDPGLVGPGDVRGGAAWCISCVRVSTPATPSPYPRSAA